MKYLKLLYHRQQGLVELVWTDLWLSLNPCLILVADNLLFGGRSVSSFVNPDKTV